MVQVLHFGFDAHPRVTDTPAGTGAAGRLDLLLPFRVEGDPAERIVSWRLDATVAGATWTDTRARRVTPELVAGLREPVAPGRFDPERAAPYLDMADRMGPGVAYIEGCVAGLPPGAAVMFALTVTVRRDQDEPVTVASHTGTTYAVRPEFDGGDIVGTHIPEPGRALEAWVLYHRREAGFDLFRVDVATLEADPASDRPDLVDLVVRVGGHTVDLRDPDPGALPLVDTAADAVTIAVPTDGGAVPTVAVGLRGSAPVEIDPAAPAPVGQARVVFVNFAIQGLNDYFATPATGYPVPRTYAQVTMRDELARFSSRPGSRENATGDGYQFTLEAHRRSGVPQMWAMNGGLLALIAHDCPAELDGMRRDVVDGVLVPVVAGYGAHRLPYYSAATNLDAITWGAAAMDAILGRAGAVYYPDSRIVTDRPNVTEALLGAGVEYLVVDAGEHEDGRDELSTLVADAVPPMGAVTDGRWVNWQYLWRDRRTGIRILFIDPELKDGLFAASDREAARGKVALGLRRKFIELACQPALRRENLLVYSDDADKASGNGWFDGVYDGHAVPYNQLYQAALGWVGTHPWVRAVTTDDLTDADVVGELDLVSACDPYITKHWRLPGVGTDPDFGLAFDTWNTAWREVDAAWLGENLGAISDRAERAIATRPTGPDGRPANRLDELARLAFTMGLHESQWSKRARQGPGDDPAHFTGPEDFVVAASLQLRNVHVYLSAAVWADWARTGTGHHRDAGPVIEQLAAQERAADGATPPAWRRPGDAGLQWDHDPLPNVILYNAEALVVIDLNGGRVTHLFAMVDGRPCSLSGTFKAYQFLDLDWASDAGLKCDGIVVQNTVCTPNHTYVACDVVAARGTIGAGPPDEQIFDWYYPDNFNAYRVVDGDDTSVTLAYEDGDPPDHPTTLTDLDARLVQDRAAKIAGRCGVVLHDVARYGAFRKTIRLDGRVVRVSYAHTRPGHVVANEFCVDLWEAAVSGRRQHTEVDAGGRSVSVVNAAGLAVTVALGTGCEFGARRHRVMTDDVEIVAPAGGGFDYEIVLPAAVTGAVSAAES